MSPRRELLTQTAAASVLAVSSFQAAGADESVAGKKPTVKADKGPRKGPLVRLDILGVGDISPHYFKQVAISKRTRFVATCAHRLDSAKKRAQEYGIPAWYDDYSAMYERERPDGEGLVEHFVDCIEGAAHPACGGEQQVHEILFKSYDASRTGQTQALETTFTLCHVVDPEFMATRSRPV